MDDFEKKILEAKEDKTIKNNNPRAIYNKALKSKETKGKFNLRLTLVNALILIVAIGFFVFGTIRNINVKNIEKQNLNNNALEPTQNVTLSEKTKTQPDVPINIEPAPSVIFNNDVTIESENLRAFESEEELKNYLSSDKKTVKTSSSTLYSKFDEAELSPAGSEVDNSYTETTYQTNTRVAGVDESDVVKVNGDYIYYVTYDTYTVGTSEYRVSVLRIYKHDNDSLIFIKQFKFQTEEEVVDEDDEYVVKKIITSNIANGLYVTDKYVILPVRTVEREVVYAKSDLSKVLSTYSYRNYSEFKIIDAKTCDLVMTIRTTGYNSNTRLVGNELYIINSYYDFLTDDNGNFAYPCIWLDDKCYFADYSRIYFYPNEDYTKTITSIYRVKLDDEVTCESFNIFSTYSNTIYMTQDNLYIIDLLSKNNREENYNLSYQESRIIILNISGEFTITGEVTVEGYVSDQYWIDENGEYLRVLSRAYDYETWYFLDKYVVKRTYSYDSILTVFEKTTDGFKKVSSLNNINKTTNNYSYVSSARFNGDILTISFSSDNKAIYYVDLEDPYNPTISSSQVTTSNGLYQLPYKDNYLIVFATSSSDSYHGIIITLYDTTDKNDIKPVGEPYKIPYHEYKLSSSSRTYYDYIYVEAFSNPKAFLVNLENDLFGFSGYSYHWESSNNYYAENSYYLFKINLDSSCPFEILNLTQDKYNSNTYVYYQVRYNRMVYVGDTYYLLSSNSIKEFKYDENGFNEVREAFAKQ